MPTPHRGSIAAAVTAAFLTAVAALVAVPSAASAQGTLDPLFGAPTVGDCKNYSWDLADDAVETSEPVDCATTHTAKVIGVKLLPDTLSWDSSQDALIRYTAKQCELARQEALGRTDKLRALSAYSAFFFWPTNAQKENGARWVRCDVVLYGVAKLLPLPVDTLPLLPSAPLPDSVARCHNRDHWVTACSKAHAWRATGAKTVDRDTYPGRKYMVRLANNKCPGLTTGNTWYATWYGRFYWKLGNHTLVCYSKTSS